MVFHAAFALLRVCALTAFQREDAKRRKGIGTSSTTPMLGKLKKSKEELERMAAVVVDAAFAVHSALGPGLLESVYQACLVHELRQRGLHVECEVPFPVTYANLTIETGYRADVVVEGDIIVENKVLQNVAPVHRAQLLTYLRISGLRLGFLINWNVPRIKDGIRRIVNNL